MKHRHSFLAAGSSYGFYAMGHCSRIVPMNLLDLIILIPIFFTPEYDLNPPKSTSDIIMIPDF